MTPRAVLMGMLFITLFSLAEPYLYSVLNTQSLGSGQLMPSCLLVLFLLVTLNTVLARVRPRLAFSRAELLVIYGMLIVSLGLLQQGGLPYIVAILTYPFYAATPENQWQHLILPHIPAWFRAGSPEAVNWLWEGMPPGASIPWGAWTTPWLAWGGFTFALLTAMYCLGALLSHDWIHKQRLTFPLLEVPLAITGEDERPSLGRSLLRNRLFWAGFSLPALLNVFVWLHRVAPTVPAPDLVGIDIGLPFAGMGLPWSVLRGTTFSLMFSVIGILCLLPTEVALSLWLFYVLYKLQLLGWASLGLSQGGGQASVDPQSFVSYEEAGAYIAFSVILLWQSRQFIGRAWLALAGRGKEQEGGPYAPLAGRWAVLGLLVSCGFMLWFGVQCGMAWWAFVLLFGSFFTILLGISRLVTAAGVVSPDTGRYSYAFWLRMLGGSAFSPPSLVAHTYFSFIYMMDPMNLAMPQMMNGFRLAESGRVAGRRWTLAMAVAVATVIVAGIVGLLIMLYHEGAWQLPVWPFYAWSDWAFTDLSHTLRNPIPPDNALRLAVVVGAVAMTGLVLLHTYTLWWPVSPVGLLIASTYTEDVLLWHSAFIAWLITSQLKRYGGLRLYRAARPVFLGLILGDTLCNAFLGLLITAVSYGRVMGG